MTRVPLASPDELEALGLLARQVAHDFNNFLSSILGYATLLKGKLEAGDPRHRYAAMIERAGTEAGAAAERLQMFGRIWTMPPSLIPVELAAFQEEVVHIAEGGPDTICAEVAATRTDAKRRVRVDLRQLRRGVGALTLNAAEAQPKATPPRVDLRFTVVAASDLPEKPAAQAHSAEWLRIEVIDHGEGMAPDVVALAARPGFTTRQGARRQGLGIATAQGFAHAHGGLLEIETELGQGTAARIWLPL